MTSSDEQLTRRPGRWWRRVVWLGIAAPLLLFTLLATLVVPRAPGVIDRAVFAHLYSGVSDWPLGPTPGMDNPFLQKLMPQLFRLTDDREIALLVAVGFLGLVIARRFRAVVFAVAVLAVGASGPFVKNLFDRGSPFPLPGDNSFPSSHGMATMALAGIAVVLAGNTRARVPMFVVAGLFVLAIGAAVIADGGHWLSDVVAGWCLSIAWITTVCIGVARLAGDAAIGDYLLTRHRSGRWASTPTA